MFSLVKNARQIFLNTLFFQLIQSRNTYFDTNQISSELPEVLAATEKPAILQEPEKTVLAQLREQLPNMRMLDIGVGLGRTTQYFAGLTKEYYGVDYSTNMIESCKRLFQNHPKNISFLKADASNLDAFPENFFDLVLFSYNGIDYSDDLKRKKILQEIWRVTKPDGYFCFSTHNLDCIDYCTPKFPRNPILFTENVARLLCMRLVNRKVWKTMRNRAIDQEYTIINDGVLNFSFHTYYTTMAAQINQLKEAGFSVINVYNLSDGSPVKTLNETTSQWLYYLTQTQKPKNTQN